MTKDGTLIDEDSIDVAQPSQDANTEQVPLSLLLSRFIAETNARQSVSDAKSEVSASPIPAVDESELDGGLTSPGMPAAKAAAEAVRERRGDVAQLLAAIGPFLWSLEAAQQWIRDHGAGEPTAEAHARSLGLLARILAQLQSRIDEVEK